MSKTCNHLHTEISQPDHNGNAIQKCQACGYEKTVPAIYDNILILLGRRELKHRKRAKNDYEGNYDMMLNFKNKMTA